MKPANLGSSVGVSKARTAAEFADALRLAFRYDTKAIVEEFVEGRELECAVLGNDDPVASVPGEVLPSHEFYDYEAKYLDEHGAALEIPARLPRPRGRGARPGRARVQGPRAAAAWPAWTSSCAPTARCS